MLLKYKGPLGLGLTGSYEKTFSVIPSTIHKEQTIVHVVTKIIVTIDEPIDTVRKTLHQHLKEPFVTRRKYIIDEIIDNIEDIKDTTDQAE